VVGVPQFCGHEEVVPLDGSGGQTCIQNLTHLAFVAIAFCAVEVAKSDLQCIFGSAGGASGIWD
jgi:hypothetical protein